MNREKESKSEEGDGEIDPGMKEMFLRVKRGLF